MTSFLSDSPINTAYLGKLAHEILITTSDQLKSVYRDEGVSIPILLSSTLHHLSDHPGCSLTELARTLSIPHQLAAQRVEKLLTRGLIEKRADPRDGRRFELHPTDAGQAEAGRLKACMAKVAEVYQQLFDEIDCDLCDALNRALTAIHRTPLAQRYQDMHGSPSVQHTMTTANHTENS